VLDGNLEATVAPKLAMDDRVTLWINGETALLLLKNITFLLKLSFLLKSFF